MRGQVRATGNERGQPMNIAGISAVVDAQTAFERVWAQRHPGMPPPSLYPERPYDAAWREADLIMDQALATARAALGQDVDFRAAATTAGQWTVSAGWIGCPNNHAFAMKYAYCPHCGAGPVGPLVQQQAEEAAMRLGEKAGLALLHLGGVR